MAAPVLLDVLIEAALVSLVKTGAFPKIVYAEDGTPSADEDDDEALVSLAPAEVSAWPLSARFDVDDNHGMAWRQRRTEWLWNVAAHWDERVSLELFEKARLASPTFIARDRANGITQQVELRFARGVYGLRPRGQTSLAPSVVSAFKATATGTRVNWTVQASPSPA